MKNFRGIIFDLDGVIIDSEPIHAMAKRKSFEKYGFQVPEEEFDEFVGESDLTVAEYVVAHYGKGNISVQELIEDKQGEFRKLLPSMKTIPGALEFLNQVSGRYKNIALVTSATPRNQELSLDKFGLEKYFHIIINVDDVENPKPAPEPYLKAIDTLSLPAEECLVIEDSISGVKAAHKAGCYVVALSASLEEETLYTAGANRIFHSFGEIAEWLSL
jgi:beta-phosphoglucomutase